MLRIFGLANMSFSTHDNVCSHVFLYVEKGDIDHMILVHVAFFLGNSRCAKAWMVKKYVTHCVFIRCFWSVITFERGSNPMNCLVEALTLLLLLRLIGASIPPVVYPCVNTISAAALDELHHFFWWRFRQ